MSEFSENSRCNELFDQAICRIQAGEHLEAPTMHAIVQAMMLGEANDIESASFLTELHLKGETAHELAGAAAALREFMTPIQTHRTDVIDTCGTGGGGANTFNISTAVALVCGAAGAAVAKHGNKRSTSKSGSSDVLEVLGVNIMAPIEIVQRCLNDLGVCFCFAPLFHPSVRRIMGVRRSLPHPTIFNLLGPLCNPANAPFQLLGVGRGETRVRVAEALCELGTQRAFVVHGEGGIGEVSLAGPTQVSRIENGTIYEEILEPEQLGIARQALDPLVVDSPEQSARIITSVLENRPGPARDIVKINAAVALTVAGQSTDYREGLSLAEEAIASGAAQSLLQKLIQLTAAPVN